MEALGWYWRVIEWQSVRASVVAVGVNAGEGGRRLAKQFTTLHALRSNGRQGQRRTKRYRVQERRVPGLGRKPIGLCQMVDGTHSARNARRETQRQNVPG